MPYVVPVEQGTLRLLDEELYQELVELRNGSGQDRHRERGTGNVAIWGSKARRPVEWVEYSRWCPKTLRRVQVTIEDCKTVEDCHVFLEEEMMKYKAFEHRHKRQQRQQGRRGRRGDEEMEVSGAESGSNEEEDSDGQTSDKASMVQKRRQQGRRV